MNATSAFDSLFGDSTKIDFIIMGIMSLLNIIIYPFYAYAYNTNRERDEKTVVFPLTNRLFQIVQKSYLPFLFVTVTMSYYTFSMPDHQTDELNAVCWLCFGFSILYGCVVYMLHLTAEIVPIIIFLLAVERFCLYFCPSINISSLPKYIDRYIYYIYGVLIAKDIIIFLSYVSKHLEYHMLVIVYGGVFLFFNMLILTSALLYIPIVIKIRKLKTFQQGFWQTITAFGFKIISIPIMFNIIATHIIKENVVSIMFAYSIKADVIFIPLIVQVSYLGCNRKPLKSLFANFCLKTFINTVLDRKPSTVEPSVQQTEEYISETKV